MLVPLVWSADSRSISFSLLALRGKVGLLVCGGVVVFAQAAAVPLLSLNVSAEHVSTVQTDPELDSLDTQNEGT